VTYALDTNIFIDSFRDKAEAAALLTFLGRALPFTFMSAVVMQELAAGAPDHTRQRPSIVFNHSSDDGDTSSPGRQHGLGLQLHHGLGARRTGS
jgi:hypothetical protein